MRVMMVGGTGFLGFFTCRALLAAGHEPIAIGLAPPAEGTMPDGVRSIVCNVDTCCDDELSSLLEGTDCIIDAAGADGRFSDRAPVIDAYRARNVKPMERLVPAMRRAGSRSLVIFGSYYTAIARLRPDVVSLSRNPYPQSRREQTDLAFALAGSDLAVNVLELPYIFGGAPGRGTLWGFTIDKVSAPGPVEVPGGRTACVTAEQVAAAAVGAVGRTTGHSEWPIGGENLTYHELYGLFAQAIGVSPEFVPASPAAAMAAAEAQRQRLSDQGIETGYDPRDVAHWQEADLGLDGGPAMRALNYGPDDLAAAIRDTVEATRRHGGQGPASLAKVKT